MKHLLSLVAMMALGTALATPDRALASGIGDDRVPLRYWASPLFWQPSETDRESSKRSGMSPEAVFPSIPMPFVAITPCRLADTRGNGFTGEFGPPSLSAGTSRDITVAGFCGIPPNALAVSANVTVTGTLGPGFIQAYPTGGALPAVSTLNFVAGQTIANAAIVPLGTLGKATFVAGVSGTDLIVDVNGYFGPDASVSVGDIYFNQSLSMLTPNGNFPSGSVAQYSNQSILRSTATGNIYFQLLATVPSTLYGRGTFLKGAQVCYDASSGGASLGIVTLFQYGVTGGVVAVRSSVSDATVRTDVACRTYLIASPVQVQGSDHVALALSGNFPATTNMLYVNSISIILGPSIVPGIP